MVQYRFTVPNVLGGGADAAAWSDAATVVPWVLYQRYGDMDILANQFESMCAWVDHVAAIAGETYIWDKGFQFGDWLDPTAPPNQPWKARTDKVIVATAYFAHSAELVARTAEVLGRTKEHQHYAELADKIKKAFADEYITPAGRMMSDAETAYALALVFDLLPNSEQRQRAGDRLSELVRDSGYHIRTGFVGTPLICDALSRTGHYLTAYRLLTQTENPSWLYPITMGATTVWERWDSMLPDGSINPDQMTSFNHYALGAVADWMQRTIGGLSPAQPGYKTIKIKPRPGGGISHAQAKHHTPYGMATCAWRIENNQFSLEVTIPPNTTAYVHLPSSTKPIEIGAGSHTWTVDYQDPDARGPFTVDDIAGEILSNKEAGEVILGVLKQLDAPPFLGAVLFNDRGVPLRQALVMLPNYEEAVEIMNEALAKLD